MYPMMAVVYLLMLALTVMLLRGMKTNESWWCSVERARIFIFAALSSIKVVVIQLKVEVTSDDDVVPSALSK
jgi:hypothetical protein